MRERVVIIEDEKDIVELVSYALRKEGFDVQGFIRGKEGLEHLRYKPADLVLLDILLPDLDGLETSQTSPRRVQASSLPSGRNASPPTSSTTSFGTGRVTMR